MNNDELVQLIERLTTLLTPPLTEQGVREAKDLITTLHQGSIFHLPGQAESMTAKEEDQPSQTIVSEPGNSLESTTRKRIPAPIPQLPSSIAEVIERLEEIIGYAVILGNRAGYFAVLYHRVTVAVQEGLQNGRFKNPELMEKLDVVFSNRYLTAFYLYSRRRDSITESWRIAFDALTNYRLVAIQHLLLGMNAHINLDLPIATAECVGDAVDVFMDDYFEITRILIDLTKEVTESLIEISPGMAYYYKLPPTKNFTHTFLKITRAEAWEATVRLSRLSKDEKEHEFAALDANAARLAKEIITPPGLLGLVLKNIALKESKDVTAVTRTLRKELEPISAPAGMLAKSDDKARYSFWNGPTSITEAILWIVWPFYLRRRAWFFAFLVLGILGYGGSEIWIALDPSVKRRVVDTFLMMSYGGAAAYDGVQMLDKKVVLDFSELRTVPTEK